MSTVLVTLVFLAALWVVVMTAARGRVGVLHVLLAWLTPVTFGLLRLPDAGLTVGLYLAGMTALAVGHALPLWSPAPAAAPSSTARPLDRRREDEALTPPTVALVVLAAFAAYHYARVGIPVLSPSVEHDRWNFTGSGLYGLPGRALLFGLPIAYLHLEGVAARLGTPRARRRARQALVTYGTLFALSGFKSALLQVLVVVLIAQLLYRPRPHLGAFARRYGPGVAAAGLFVWALLGSYDAFVRHHSSETPLQLVVDRVTLVPATVADFTVDVRATGSPLNGRLPTYRDDAETYLRNYLPGVADSEEAPFNKQVSASLRGQPLAAADEAVSTTPTGIATLYYNGGVLAVIAGSLLGGVALHAAARHAAVARSGGATVAAVAAVIVVREFSGGGLAFELLNWSTMLLVFGGLVVAARAVIRTRRGVPVVTPSPLAVSLR